MTDAEDWFCARVILVFIGIWFSLAIPFALVLWRERHRKPWALQLVEDMKPKPPREVQR